MKNKLTIMLLAVAASLAANAGLLYWQVDSAAVDTAGKDLTYSYAAIFQADNTSATSGTAGKYTGTKLTDYYGENATDATTVNYASSAVLAAAGVDAGTVSGSYYVELYDSNKQAIYQSALISAETLQSYVSNTTEFNSNWKLANTYTAGGTYTATPEPTSGLLLLMGAGLLALRRRKVA